LALTAHDADAENGAQAGKEQPLRADASRFEGNAEDVAIEALGPVEVAGMKNDTGFAWLSQHGASSR
jgi:hypothetical protein